MTILKRIGLVSFGKIAALFGLVHGLLVGLLYGVVIEIIGFTVHRPGIAGFIGLSLIVITTIGGGIIGFILGIIHAFLYNVFSGAVGGIEIEVSH